jgi:hypothetical protein
MNYSLSPGLWFTAQFLQAGILVALFARGWLRRYPAFTAYIILEMVSDPFLAFANTRWPYVYYFGYWATVVASTALLVAVLYEVVQHLWRPFDGWRKLSATLVWLVLALFLAQSVIFLSTSVAHSYRMDSITSLVLLADRDVRIVTCGLAVFILLFRKRLGMSWREFGVGIIAGFVLFSTVNLMVATAMSHHAVFHRSTLSAINSGAYLLTALIWLGYATLSPNLIVGGSGGSTPPQRSWPGGYALRATEPWWSRLRFEVFLSANEAAGPSRRGGLEMTALIC